MTEEEQLKLADAMSLELDALMKKYFYGKAKADVFEIGNRVITCTLAAYVLSMIDKPDSDVRREFAYELAKVASDLMDNQDIVSAAKAEAENEKKKH